MKELIRKWIFWRKFLLYFSVQLVAVILFLGFHQAIYQSIIKGPSSIFAQENSGNTEIVRDVPLEINAPVSSVERDIARVREDAGNTVVVSDRPLVFPTPTPRMIVEREVVREQRSIIIQRPEVIQEPVVIQEPRVVQQPQVVQPAVIQPTLVQTCKGTLTLDDLKNQLRGANFPGPFDNTSEMIAAFNRAACPPVPAIPPPAVIVRQTPSVACPAGTVATRSGDSIVCLSQPVNTPVNVSNFNQNTNNNVVDRVPVVFAVERHITPTQTPQVVVAPAAAKPEVQVVPVASTPIVTKELPKTGLPAAAVFLSGLLPLGAFFRKFSSSEESESAIPTYFWQKRKFDRGS